MKVQEIIPNPDQQNVLFKPVIRSSNSVYYPNILSSIFIPANDELNASIIGFIKEENEDGSTVKQIARSLKRYKEIELAESEIQNLIDNNFNLREAEIAKTENQYRDDEYKYFTLRGSENILDKLVFSKIRSDFYPKDLIKSVYKMDMIKITSVQTSFTRQEPIPYDSYLVQEEETDDRKVTIRKQYTSKEGLRTKFLPAIESFGEGIFFDFDEKTLKDWVNNNENVKERITNIIINHSNIEVNFNSSLNLTPQYVLIHTFSHLIIKELEYLCGYPSTSLQERLYIDEHLGMQGVLIYTVAGSEGSYGGITSLCDDDKIGKLIKSAINRATDCATDPICYHTDGQGVSNLNLSACFSCTLLPETSCEMFNSYLDRRILIDRSFGYFKDLVINF